MLRRAFLVASLLLASASSTACSTYYDTHESEKAMSGKTEIVLINPFEVSTEQLDETILMWEQARDFLQTQPGYISTELHQSLAPDARFRLINVAKWESAESFQAATKKMQAEANLPRIEGVIASPSLFTVIRRD